MQGKKIQQKVKKKIEREREPFLYRKKMYGTEEIV